MSTYVTSDGGPAENNGKRRTGGSPGRLGRRLVLSVGVSLAASACGPQPATDAPPSVLLVTLDTTRADHLGCYGAAFASTPNLDQLARDGVRFDHALSPVPLTLPSHASILTGRVPRRHGVRNNALFRLGPEPAVLAGELQRHGYRTAAFVSAVVLDRITGLDRGFEHYDDSVRIGSRQAFNYKERAASQTNGAVFEYLETLTEPFFLWVHYFDPHLPFDPPEPFRGRFPNRPYDGEIAFMDQQFGSLLQQIRNKTDSVLVVVAGDHGEGLGQHGEEAHGVFVYQATQHIPLIVAGPGVPRGEVVQTRVGLVDVAPTVLELLGLPGLPDIDGRSVAPLLRGRELTSAEYELESLFPLFAYGWAPVRALVAGEYKYVDAPRSELYRLSQDPEESVDLIESQPRIAFEMADDLLALTEDDVVGMPEDDPALAEQKRRLESLGYLGGSGTVAGEEVIDPKDGIAWIADLQAGRRAYQTGRPEEGIEPLERLLSHNPNNVPGLLALGICYMGVGQPARAVALNRRALEIRPDDAQAHFNLANALTFLAETRPAMFAEARVHYDRALELNPRYADAYLTYASLIEQTGANDQALALLQRARSAGVRDPEIETRIAVLELKRENVEAAKEAFRRGLELYPEDPRPLEAMGRITFRQGRYAEAAGYYERLLAVTPSARVARTLGSIRLEQLDDRAGALEAFEMALGLMGGGDPGRGEVERLVEQLSPTP
jgi:arylsulfatase A-like enzyme/cytochrome c-type biogenesis protein CcmH/NrfG